jgi:glyoxylase-like metal-dependent hydrolase (beta-lactamase superfamily II)
MTNTSFLRVGVALLFCGAIWVAYVHSQQLGQEAAKQELIKIKDDLYVIHNDFFPGNTTALITDEGVVLVDDKFAVDHDGIMAQLKKITNKPIRYVINTHHHPDHVGNNQKFIDAGATVLASDALKSFMASDPRTKAIPGLPTQTFAKEYTLKFGGAEVRLYSFGRGHTGDDTMVYFPDAKVVMVSDQITDATPIVDFANGGSAVEWTQILDGVLKLDFESAIPGRGEPKTRDEVQAYRTKFASLVSRAQDAIKAGATRDTLAMQVKTNDLGWQLNAMFFGSLYDELAKK